jgi:hypothetical protein
VWIIPVGGAIIGQIDPMTLYSKDIRLRSALASPLGRGASPSIAL